MPSCFQLTPVGERSPRSLEEIDADLCNHFGEPVDSERYFACWPDSIGLALVCGETWEGIKEQYADDETVVKVADYLKENYTVNTFYQPKW